MSNEANENSTMYARIVIIVRVEEQKNLGTKTSILTGKNKSKLKEKVKFQEDKPTENKKLAEVHVVESYKAYNGDEERKCCCLTF